jgi:hypothetical protein
MKNFAITATCLLGCALAGCTAPPADTGATPPEIILEGVGFRFFRGSELRARGQANVATFRRDTGDVTAHRVRLVVDRDGQGDTVRFDAVSASGNVHTQLAAAAGGVHLADAQGTRGTTERARLDGKAGRVDGRDPVDVVGSGFRMHGENGFVLDLVGEDGLLLKGPVTTLVRGTP